MSKPGRGLGLLFLLLALGGEVRASTSLLYFEAQAVAGYSSGRDKIIFYSRDSLEAMQKPSLGFDYVLRFSGATRDWAVAAFQARLAWNAEGRGKVEPQVYNAYLKFKTGAGDVWLGHNRAELGLSSYFDSHALLLGTLAMNGFGFDRDWGLGLKKDTAWGSLGLALTTGSGMPLVFRGNYLASGRLSWGVLERDNSMIGFSAAVGRTLETMGWHILSHDPQRFAMAGLDGALLWNNLENRAEFLAGEIDGRGAAAFLWRTGIALFEEGRLKLEVQPAFWKIGGQSSFRLSAGATYLASSVLTLRALVERDPGGRDIRYVFQVYYYDRIRFR